MFQIWQFSDNPGQNTDDTCKYSLSLNVSLIKNKIPPPFPHQSMLDAVLRHLQTIAEKPNIDLGARGSLCIETKMINNQKRQYAEFIKV